MLARPATRTVHCYIIAKNTPEASGTVAGLVTDMWSIPGPN
jgi:hypothetical protein